jgi:hypothetical protein
MSNERFPKRDAIALEHVLARNFERYKNGVPAGELVTFIDYLHGPQALYSPEQMQAAQKEINEFFGSPEMKALMAKVKFVPLGSPSSSRGSDE